MMKETLSGPHGLLVGPRSRTAERRQSSLLAGLACTMGLAAVACKNGESEAWYARRAEDVRELELLEEVDIVYLSPEEYASRGGRDPVPTDEELHRYAQTYGRLGFFPIDLDLRPIYTRQGSNRTGAFYSWRTKEIVIVDHAEDNDVVAAFVVALQDQHFDLEAYLNCATRDGRRQRSRETLEAKPAS